MTILDDYLEEQSKYETKYGEKTVVFMMVGMFYEIYGVQTKDEKLGKVSEMADLLNIMMTLEKKHKPHSRKNRLIVGIPNHSVQNYISILIYYNWTVVMIDQIDLGNNLIERKVTNIYSPGTILECNDLAETNNLFSYNITQNLIDSN